MTSHDFSSEQLLPPFSEGIVHDRFDQLSDSVDSSVFQRTTIREFTAGFAHHINNLLTVILGNAELLRAENVTATGQDLIDQIVSAVDRSSETIRRLLDYAGRANPTLFHIDLNHGVLSLQPRLKSLLGEKIELVTHLDPDLPAVFGNPQYLQEMLVHLVQNSKESIRERGQVTIETHRDAMGKTGENYVELTVTDTGCGIPIEILPRVFDPFFTTKPQAIGLGLSSVYGAIRQIGGRIRLTSENKRGTTVQLFWPKANALQMLFAEKKA